MKKWVCLLGAFGLLLAAQPATAQVSFGPQLAWGDDTDLGIGARVHFDLADMFGVEDGFFADLFGMGTGTYFFIDCPSGVSCSFLEFNANAGVPFDIDGSVTPYAGAGIHLARASVSFQGFSESDTEFGLNILGGIFFPLGGLRGFAEAKFGISGADQLVLAGGVLFGGGR
jgi:opacity protein-like surface antigen